MENFIIYLLIDLPLFPLTFILCFAIPIIITRVREKKRKIKKGILNKKSIIRDSVLFSKLFAIWFLFLFSIVGISLICLAVTTAEIMSNTIMGIIFGGIMFLIPIIIIINILKDFIKIKAGKYVIVLDELVDKDYYSDRSATDTDHSHWKIIFKDYYKKYNTYVPLKNFRLANKYNIGDKFYLVFVKGNVIPYIYPLKEYTLDELEKNKLKTLEQAKNFINMEEFVLENPDTNSGKKIINKKILISDFNKIGHKKTAIIDVFLCFLCLPSFLYSIYIFYIPALILTLLMLIFCIFMTATKIKYVYSITKNIKLNNFKVKIDVVKSLNNQVAFKDSNTIISFRFKDYKKIVFADKKGYNKAAIGDEFYLVFVKGEKEPIKVYRVKDTTLDDDITSQIKF